MSPRATRWGRGLLLLLACLAAPPAQALGRDGKAARHAPALTIQRYPEDWSYLADPAERTGRWTERFKYIPLDDTGWIYLTTGMEMRAAYEGYKNVNWGAMSHDSYIWYRFMPYMDLHGGNVRLFAQPILSDISGEEHAKRPVDTTGNDMLQAFIDADVDLSETADLRLSAGRKLISLGAGRFVDTRYGPNIPQAFDGVDATLKGQTGQLTALYARPVVNLPGDFDDRTSRQKDLWGLYATHWLTAQKSIGVDLYYLGLLDRNAIFDQGAGEERVHTFGTRFFGDLGDWFWNAEAAVQTGSFASGSVFAWGMGGEAGYRFRDVAMQPELKFVTDVISGDDDPEDAELNTFNPLFPRGKYFGALSPIGPRNLIHLRPSVTIHPNEQLSLSLTGAAYWRESTEDGIYAIAGSVVRRPNGSNARYIGKEVELSASWQATAELNLTASLSAFDPGTFIEQTGPSRTITMLGLSANCRF